MAAESLKDRPAAVRWSFAGGAADWRGALLVFVSVLVVYGPGLGDRFHYDDFHSVVHNPHLRSAAHLGDFFVDPSLFSANPAGAMYRPLLLASYVANFAIDDRALFFRWGNLLLHAGNSVLVLWFLRRLGGRAALALGAALVFALNPLNSEAVHYISSR